MNYKDYIKDLRIKINNALDEFIKKNTPTDNRIFYNIAHEFIMAGGKRLRPLSFLITYHINKKDNKAVLPSLSVELLHSYSLILDDLMDEDEVRRNKSTVHIKLMEYFSKVKSLKTKNTRFFSSSEKRFSTAFTIMVANIVNSLSRKAIIDSDFNDYVKTRALELINNADIKINEGQLMDMVMEIKESNLKEYMEMIKLKTAKLFGASFEIGSVFSGNDEEKNLIFREIGINFALAFQIRDDLIDILEIKKREKYSDIRNGKKTILYFLTLESLAGAEKKFFLSKYGNITNEQELRKILYLMNKSGAIRAAKKYLIKFKNRAIELSKKTHSFILKEFLERNLEISTS